MQEARAERLSELGLPTDPQVLTPSRINHLLSSAARALQTDGRTCEPEDLEALWARYLWSAYWQTRTPPFPLEGFAASGTLARCDALWGTARDPVTTREVWS